MARGRERAIALGTKGRPAHNAPMKRWRSLFVLLGCFAVLLVGVPIAGPMGRLPNPAATECKAVPAGAGYLACAGACTWGSAGCRTTCIGSGSVLSVLSLDAWTPTASGADQTWSSILRGLSPRPDPYPPRA